MGLPLGALPFGLKGAPNTKIFGPYETNGGFSTRYAFGYWLGMSYVIAVGDSIGRLTQLASRKPGTTWRMAQPSASSLVALSAGRSTR